MHALRLAALLALTSLLAGCADEEGAPEPTPSASRSATDAPATNATSTGTSSSSSSSASIGPRPAQTHQVGIQGNSFVGGTKTVQEGDTVVWTQKDQAPHTVTADGGEFESPTLYPIPTQDTFEHTFDKTGEFRYHCEVHPSMTGTITVVEALPA